MDTIVPCPQCQRRLRISADHLGKKLKCPACGQVILTDKAETTSHRSAPATGGTSNLKGMRTGAEERNKSLSGSRSAKGLKAGPADSDAGAGVGRKSQPVKFPVRVKHDPDRILKGGYLAELGRCRLILHPSPRQRGNLPPRAVASRLANRGRAGPQHAEQRGVHHALRGASQGSPRQACRCREPRAADPERRKPNDTHRDRAGAGLESSRDHRRGAPRDPCHHAATSSTCTRGKS